MAPLPENKSKKTPPSILSNKILNTASFALSVVGLMPLLWGGGASFLPLYFPLIILKRLLPP
jgi:hypothetical protein